MSVSVSIIMPVYNAADFITGTLRSVIDQTFQNFDLLMVDDCGQDDSIAIAESFLIEHGFHRYRILRHEVNSGPSQARNTGLKCSDADYILFVDSDDILDERCLELLSAPLNEVRYDFVTAGYMESRRGEGIPHYGKQQDIMGNVQEVFVQGDMNVMPWNKLCRRKFLIDNELYFEPKIHVHEDYIWTYSMTSKADSAKILSDITYVYNVRSESLMTSLTIAKDLEWYVIALKRMASFKDERGLDWNANDYMIIEGKKSGILYSLLQKKELALYDNVYPVFREMVKVSPIKAYKEGMISLSYLLRDIHFCFPVWLGKVYKRLFYVLYYKLRGQSIRGAIWGE